MISRSIHLYTTILTLFFLGLGLFNCTARQENPDKSPEAWLYITQTVSEKLGDMKKIQFPPTGKDNITRIGDNRYQVTSYVEYLNKEDESQRTYFYGTVVLQGDSWAVDSLKFSE